MSEKVVKKGKRLEGRVVGNKMDKTVKVLVEKKQRHPIYKKLVNYRKTYFARTDKQIEVGERVVIRESKPFSKNVRWIIEENDTKRK